MHKSLQQDWESWQGRHSGPQALSLWQGTQPSPEGSKPSSQSKAHWPFWQVAVELTG